MIDMRDPEHGTRARYVRDACRCAPCRAANTQYARDRADLARAAAAALPRASHCTCGRKLRSHSTGSLCGECRPHLIFNGLVDARPARDHMRRLSAAGVGYKAVAAASDVAPVVLWAVNTGRKRHIRRDTERRILEIDERAKSDGAKVDARPTRALLRDLLAEGYTKGRIARMLGSATPALQIGTRDQVTLRTAAKVARLHRQHIGEVEAVESDDAYLLRLVSGALPATVARLHEIVIADYGAVTMRTLHRWLAAWVAAGPLVRTAEGYALRGAGV